MFQKFTERSRRAILLAQEEATRLGTQHVGTEHLFLGLIAQSDCFAAQLLEKCGASLTAVAASVKAAAGPIPTIRTHDPKLTPQAKRALQDAAEQSRHLGHDYIGTGHLLLALLQDPQSIVTRCLANHGLARERVCDAVVKNMGQAGPPPRTMWDRFTERLRCAILLGQEEAGKRKSADVSPELLLFGLVSETECVAAKSLQQMGVKLQTVRQQIAAEAKPGDSTIAPEPKLTPEAKRVLELTSAEARRQGHKFIATEHLLLALLQDPQSPGAQILATHGVTLESARAHTAHLRGPAGPLSTTDDGEPPAPQST